MRPRVTPQQNSVVGQFPVIPVYQNLFADNESPPKTGAFIPRGGAG
jgi:hypothetical protein